MPVPTRLAWSVGRAGSLVVKATSARCRPSLSGVNVASSLNDSPVASVIGVVARSAGRLVSVKLSPDSSVIAEITSGFSPSLRTTIADDLATALPTSGEPTLLPEVSTAALGSTDCAVVVSDSTFADSVGSLLVRETAELSVPAAVGATVMPTSTNLPECSVTALNGEFSVNAELPCRDSALTVRSWSPTLKRRRVDCAVAPTLTVPRSSAPDERLPPPKAASSRRGPGSSGSGWSTWSASP